MFQWIIKKIIGSKNQRELRKIWPLVKEINRIEEDLQNISEEELREKTTQWKEQLRKISDPSEQQKFLEEILPQAFAVVKNACRRLCGRSWTVCDQSIKWEMVPFDVQLIGGIALHRGTIAEMATGEGKTLVATLPLYLNALTNRGVHLITVNDYLARRDSEWTGEVLRFLGLTVGCIQSQQPPDLRREQYTCDVTYGTSSEFGFDYLRDNGMATTRAEQVQRGHYYSIVDEVDSILIDEARTPLIISGPVTVSTTHQYDRYKPLVEQLVKKQSLLCNQLISEAKELREKESNEEVGMALLKVKMGQPKNRGFLRLMEEPEMRRLVDQAELSLYQDSQKKALFALKEELFFSIDEKSHDADLSEQGRQFLNPDDPEAFVLPDLITAFSEIDGNTSLTDAQKSEKKEALQKKLDFQGERIHSISQLLKAYCLYEKDVDYVISNGRVVIVDENTGREMPGRRWGDGLHQAVEAKEGVKIDKETQTLATITVQNYFRLYEKLAGMTGTAETEAAEFHDIYHLDVLNIPTNKPVARVDLNDCIYKTRREKYKAVIDKIHTCHAEGQPVLIGTASVEASETLSRMLKREKIPHNVLNAKYHRQEAEIIARAGQRGAVTVSTNMAGRGTDIKLGEGITELGGLCVVGTERHESRRIDRQLRGRCARQGDPGSSLFFISFEDDLMRNFGASERMTKMMERFGLEEGQELQHPLLNRSVESAQKRVEQRNYLIRKRVLDYDDVMNQQREVVYEYRNEVIQSDNPRELIEEVIEEAVPLKIEEFCPASDPENANYSGLLNWVNTTFPLRLAQEEAHFSSRNTQENGQFLIEKIKNAYALKCKHENQEALNELERFVLLSAIDRLWQEHLYNMDALREGIHLRAHGQKDPLIEYKQEAYEIFVELMHMIKMETLANLFRSTTNLREFENFLATLPQQLSRDTDIVNASNLPAAQSSGEAYSTNEQPKITLPVKRELPKVGRNEACPCGSGKKYKKCCGRFA